MDLNALVTQLQTDVTAIANAVTTNPTPTVDPLRTVVEAQLTSEGWTAPAVSVPVEVETPAEDASSDTTETDTVVS